MINQNYLDIVGNASIYGLRFVERCDIAEFFEKLVSFQVANLVPAGNIVDGLERLGRGALRFEAGQQTIHMVPVVHGAWAKVKLSLCVPSKIQINGDKRKCILCPKTKPYPKGFAMTFPIRSCPTAHFSLHFLQAARPDFAFSMIKAFSMVVVVASVSDIIYLQKNIYYFIIPFHSIAKYFTIDAKTIVSTP